MTYRLVELPLRPPEDRLGDMSELLEPLGWRSRAPLEESGGEVDPFRGKVVEDPGRFREAEDNCSLISKLVLPLANGSGNMQINKKLKLIRILF